MEALVGGLCETSHEYYCKWVYTENQDNFFFQTGISESNGIKQLGHCSLKAIPAREIAIMYISVCNNDLIIFIVG